MRLFVDNDYISDNISKEDIKTYLNKYVFQDSRSESRVQIINIVEERLLEQHRLFQQNDIKRVDANNELTTDWKDLLSLRDIIKEFITETKNKKVKEYTKRYFGKEKTEKYHAMQIEDFGDNHTIADIENFGEIYSELTGVTSTKSKRLKNKEYVLTDEERDEILENMLSNVVLIDAKDKDSQILYTFEGEGEQNKEFIFSGLTVKKRGLVGEVDNYIFNNFDNKIKLDNLGEFYFEDADEFHEDKNREKIRGLIKTILEDEDFEDTLYDPNNEYFYKIELLLVGNKKTKELQAIEDSLIYTLELTINPNEEIVIGKKAKSDKQRNVARAKYFDEILGRLEHLEDEVDDMPEE